MNGSAGKGGNGGASTRNADILDCFVLILEQKSAKFFDYKWERETSFLITDRKWDRIEPDEMGEDGRNNNSISQPKICELFKDKWRVINSFKNFFTESLTKSIVEKGVRNWLINLEANKDIKQLYDAMGFINEFEGIENQYIPCGSDDNISSNVSRAICST